ncbi:hypothetical protein HAZT_HAZT008128 [Hyalella azteca]|uniref:L-Fucosyltransferase n=1 Tax=Hyalella azteca TaxID=294128 RepID=A0A6A0H185_HYAAZ|nr:hypothetical protein HAZT_HAZT008128 [Hyalella azteca]
MVRRGDEWCVVVMNGASWGRMVRLGDEWCVLVTNGTAAEDMCLLALCHHRIMTFGTFGFWAGYLGRGTTLYPDLEYPDAPYMLTRARYTHARVTSFIPVPFYPQR